MRNSPVSRPRGLISPVRIYRQAAALPWRKTGGGLEVLLITTRDVSPDSPGWILPQGGVEPGESTREAALAETWEEAGVRGAASTEALAHYEYETGAGRCAVAVFGLEVEDVEDDWPEREDRERRWLSPADAREAIAGHTLKRVLEECLLHLEE